MANSRRIKYCEVHLGQAVIESVPINTGIARHYSIRYLDGHDMTTCEYGMYRLGADFFVGPPLCVNLATFGAKQVDYYHRDDDVPAIPRAQ